MVAGVVETPALRGIIYRFLLAHAERPDLLRGSKHFTSRKFAERSPFYDDFVQEVSRHVPSFREHTEARLLDTNAWTTQADFKAVLAVFKEMSGIHNPAYFNEIGRVIPVVGDDLTALAGMAALNPGKVIQMSPGYNHKFNNDQHIIVEGRDDSDPRLARARVQHYFLPSAEEPYLEMVTAAFGYWEGIPGLRGFPEVGRTNLFEVQMTLRELVERDYAYLNFEYDEDGERVGDIVRINGITIGKRPSLESVLQYEPSERHLARHLAEYRPVLVTNSVEVDGDVIFPSGTLYGMPCNRYDVEVPHPHWLKRMWYTLRLIPKLRRDARAKTFTFLGKKPADTALSDQLRATATESIHKVEAQIKETEARADAASARAEAAEARVSEAEARATAAEAKLALEEQVRDVNQIFGDMRTLAHDNKNHCLTLVAEAVDLLRERTEGYTLVAKAVDSLRKMAKSLEYRLPFPAMFEDADSLLPGIEAIITDSSAPRNLKEAANSVYKAVDQLFEKVVELPFDYRLPFPEMFEDADSLLPGIKAITTDSYAPPYLQKVADYIVRLQKVIENERVVMSGGIPINIVDLSYSEIMGSVVGSVNKVYPSVNVDYLSPEGDLLMKGDTRLLKAALTNLVSNAVEASLPTGNVRVEPRQSRRGQRTFTIIEIYQSGLLPEDIAERLNRGESFTTKAEGNAIGAVASYNIIKDPHNGSLEYRSLGDEGGYVKVAF